MKNYRKGVFFIVYTIPPEDEILYLALKRKLHWIGWEFPKGEVKDRENLLDTVKRELKEETGLKPKNIKKFNNSGRFDYTKKYAERKGIKGQTYEAVFAVEIDSKKIKNTRVDKMEHSGFKWLSFEKAIKKLTWKNQDKCIRLIHEWLVGKKYKGFRKTITTSGRLLLAGKDEKSNEKLIKTSVKKEDFVFHTSKPGSAFVVIKGGDKINKKDIREAAIFCAKHSQDYRDNKSDVRVHYFLGKDIYKRKDMKVGTFGVKNFKEIKIKKSEIKN